VDPLYEYDIIDEPPAFACIRASSKEIPATTKAKVMLPIDGKSLYIIDENGKSQKATYLRANVWSPLLLRFTEPTHYCRALPASMIGRVSELAIAAGISDHVWSVRELLETA
jgi:hypothetical protein